MDLQGIKIQKLFGDFDYTISLNPKEGITILSGPNGYGKTTILNIIFHFFKQNFFFFQYLNFESITFFFPNENNIIITKYENEETIQIIKDLDDDEESISEKFSFIDIILELRINDKRIETFTFNSDIERKLFNNIIKLYPNIKRASQRQLYDSNTGNYIDIEDYFHKISLKPFDIIKDYIKQNDQIGVLIKILTSVDVYLIKEQRLIKPIANISRRSVNSPNTRRSFTYTIQSYATELSDLIRIRQAEAFQESQKLDNSFPNRIMLAEKKLSIEDFNTRIQSLTEKQKQLQQFGITLSNIEKPAYNNEKADVLSVYLDDAEKKTGFFDDLVKKINLFVTIINEKKFVKKEILINSHSGFDFITKGDKKLILTALSSGEQQEVVVMYELLFRSQPNTLILIDEPEISLHVSWQKVFINDLLSISNIKNISFLLATHSPQIINGRWDLTTDLHKLLNDNGTADRE